MGSLREAIFLQIWFNRREVVARIVQVIAQGSAEKEYVVKAFQSLILALYPFQKTITEDRDQKMKEMMKKEVGKGNVLSFQTQDTSFLKKRAKAIRKQRSQESKSKIAMSKKGRLL